MDRLSRAKAVAGEKSAALKVVLTHNPACVECVYRTWSNVCSAPPYWDASYDPVSGAVSVRKETPAKEARSEGGLCGPEGALFEPAHPVQAHIKRNAIRYFWASAAGLLVLYDFLFY